MTDPTLLDRILGPDGLTVVFQPVLQRTRGGWKLHALEGLSRGPRDTNVRAADVLFEYVRRRHVEDVVDRECITRVLRAAKDLPGTARITVNAHASTLGRDLGFLAFFEEVLRRTGIPPTRLVVEIVERSPVWDDDQLRQVLDGLRKLGSSIALDDVGLGQSNMKMILECQPDYFKVDRYLVAGSSADFYRRALLKSLSDLAGSVGAHVVAEGIEEHEDLATVLSEGITLVQGFLLARPMNTDELIASGLLSGDEIELDVRARTGHAAPTAPRSA